MNLVNRFGMVPEVHSFPEFVASIDLRFPRLQAGGYRDDNPFLDVDESGYEDPDVEVDDSSDDEEQEGSEHDEEPPHTTRLFDDPSSKTLLENWGKNVSMNKPSNYSMMAG